MFQHGGEAKRYAGYMSVKDVGYNNLRRYENKMENDWNFNGVEHLERNGCSINIKVGLHNTKSKEVTSIEIVPLVGWTLKGSSNNRVEKR